MKKLILSLALLQACFGKWVMLQSAGNTFMYNDETGELYRHYQVINKNGYIKEEGMVRVKFTSYAKYPVGANMVSPTGDTPEKMKLMEEKIINKLAK